MTYFEEHLAYLTNAYAFDVKLIEHSHYATLGLTFHCGCTAFAAQSTSGEWVVDVRTVCVPEHVGLL